MNSQLSETELLTYLNQQTAKISWSELERAFAQGLVYIVSVRIDLIEAAKAVIKDDTKQVSAYLDAQDLALVSDKQAQQWQQSDPIFWAVVSAPWVLIQLAQTDSVH